jgi:hypothetical protein
MGVMLLSSLRPNGTDVTDPLFLRLFSRWGLGLGASEPRTRGLLGCPEAWGTRAQNHRKKMTKSDQTENTSHLGVNPEPILPIFFDVACLRVSVCSHRVLCDMLHTCLHATPTARLLPQSSIMHRALRAASGRCAV